MHLLSTLRSRIPFEFLLSCCSQVRPYLSLAEDMVLSSSASSRSPPPPEKWEFKAGWTRYPNEREREAGRTFKNEIEISFVGKRTYYIKQDSYPRRSPTRPAAGSVSTLKCALGMAPSLSWPRRCRRTGGGTDGWPTGW